MSLLETEFGILTPGGLIGYQEPPVKVISPFEKTLGPKAEEFFRMVGVKLDPWQQYAMDVSLGKRPNGLWAARTFGMVIPRQNGKTELAAARILFGLYVLKEKLIIYSAHRTDTASEVFDRVEELILSSPMLKRRTKKVSHTNGKEGVITNDGCAVRFKTRKKNSGRGFSCQCLIVDEAMDCDRQFVGDVEPVISAQKNPQIWYTGSAGTEDALAFGDKRRRALGDDPGLITWLEWAIEMCKDECEPDCDEHDDPRSVESYRKSNPAYGIRIAHETIEEEWRSMEALPENFYRERLSVGTWPVDLDEFSVIPREAWESAERDANPVGQLIFSVSMNSNRTETVISAVGYTDTDQQDMVIHILPDSARGGSAWVADRLEELYQKWKPYGFCIDSRGQAATLIEFLEEKRIPVYSPSSLEYAQACAQFAVGVTGTKKEKPYIHHIGDPLLTMGVSGATKRNLSGQWAWARANDHSNITALEAATLGVWGLKKAVKESSMNYVYFKRIGGG